MGRKQKRWLLPAVCWSCCSSENRHPSDDIEPAALENESLDEECSDNIEPACELACESDSGEDERFQSTEEGVKKAKRGRKASWNEDQITDMIDKQQTNQQIHSSNKNFLQHNQCQHLTSQLSPPLSFSRHFL